MLERQRVEREARRAARVRQLELKWLERRGRRACSKCGELGHNITKCPRLGLEAM